MGTSKHDTNHFFEWLLILQPIGCLDSKDLGGYWRFVDRSVMIFKGLFQKQANWFRVHPVINVVTVDTWDDSSDLWNGLGIQLVWMCGHGNFILVRVVPCGPLHQDRNLPRIPTSSAAHPRSHLLCKARFPASICHTHPLIRNLSDSLRRPAAIFKPAVFFRCPFLSPRKLTLSSHSRLCCR